MSKNADSLASVPDEPRYLAAQVQQDLARKMVFPAGARQVGKTTLARSNLELLALRLPALVGSPLSVYALREDLQLAHKTVAKWLDALERLYAIFRLAPLSGPKIRAVKKERKHYLV